MDIDAKLKAVALSDNKLGLLQGKLGTSIYFFVMSNHDEKSEMFQTGKRAFCTSRYENPNPQEHRLKEWLDGYLARHLILGKK